MRHTITVLVENEFGVLTRVAGLFSARGYNIETLNVAPLQDHTVSRMTLVTRGDERIIEQIKKQLNKLIPVIKVEDISHAVHLERGMLMVKVQADADHRDALLALIEKHDAKILDDHPESHSIFEFTGQVELLDDILIEMEAFSIIETTRTGPLGMRRAADGFTVE
ncbi:acetolactate synthase small subunit [Mariprofundus ferrooxydans]|nr:acetolactate synthase small subunit [Mariprofundus ferrooxydans]